jgi:hypothetical protein
VLRFPVGSLKYPNIKATYNFAHGEIAKKYGSIFTKTKLSQKTRSSQGPLLS